MTIEVVESPSQEMSIEVIEDAEPKARQSGAMIVAGDSPMDRMLQALDRGLDPEKIEKMLELQERWERREAEKAFRADFASFRGENIIIPKTKHVDRGRGGSFNQAEYDKVCRRLSPALSRHGFSFRHDQKFGVRRIMTDGAENDVGWVWVTCHLEHSKGHGETLELEGPPGDLTVNTPAQNMQVTASYLKRQSLLAITGTATGEEDDESRMRQGDGGSGSGVPMTTEFHDHLLDEGREKAMEGMKALTEWWGKLDAKNRSRLQRDFTEMRRAAQEADRAH